MVLIFSCVGQILVASIREIAYLLSGPRDEWNQRESAARSEHSMTDQKHERAHTETYS